jgi:hypothetical protein
VNVDNSRIPVCRSSFLQDIGIELGRRLKSVRQRTKSGRLHFKILESDSEECFLISRWSSATWVERLGYIEIMIWDNKTANYTLQEPYLKQEFRKSVEYKASLHQLNASQIAELVRDSLLDKEGAREYWQNLNEICLSDAESISRKKMA